MRKISIRRLETWRDLGYLALIVLGIGIIVYLGFKIYDGVKASWDGAAKLATNASKAVSVAWDDIKSTASGIADAVLHPSTPPGSVLNPAVTTVGGVKIGFWDRVLHPFASDDELLAIVLREQQGNSTGAPFT